MNSVIFELGCGMGLSLSLRLFLHDWEDKKLDLLFTLGKFIFFCNDVVLEAS